jgi:hypothetical protein
MRDSTTEKRPAGACRGGLSLAGPVGFAVPEHVFAVVTFVDTPVREATIPAKMPIIKIVPTEAKTRRRRSMLRVPDTNRGAAFHLTPKFRAQARWTTRS